MQSYKEAIDLRPTRTYPANPSYYEQLNHNPTQKNLEPRGPSPLTDNGTALTNSDDLSHDRENLSICALFASRLMYTRCYLVFYVFVTVLTFILIIYDIGQRDKFIRQEIEPMWFIILDTACVGFLIIEVVIRYFASQVTFWRSPFNIFDCLVVILCVLALVLYSHVPDSDVISAASLLLRYITQLMRLIIFLRWLSRNHNALVAAETTRVDFQPRYKRNASDQSLYGYHGEYWDTHSLMSWGTAGSSGGSNRGSRDPRWQQHQPDPKNHRPYRPSRDPRYEPAESVAESTATAVI